MGLSPGDNPSPAAILRCKWCSYRPWLSCTHPTRGCADLMTAGRHRLEMTIRFTVWNQITGSTGLPTTA